MAGPDAQVIEFEGSNRVLEDCIAMCNSVRKAILTLFDIVKKDVAALESKLDTLFDAKTSSKGLRLLLKSIVNGDCKQDNQLPWPGLILETVKLLRLLNINHGYWHCELSKIQ